MEILNQLILKILIEALSYTVFLDVGIQLWKKQKAKHICSLWTGIVVVENEQYI